MLELSAAEVEGLVGVEVLVAPVVALASVAAGELSESLSFARQGGEDPIVPIKRTTRANRRGFICVPHRFDGFIE